MKVSIFWEKDLSGQQWSIFIFYFQYLDHVNSYQKSSRTRSSARVKGVCVYIYVN